MSHFNILATLTLTALALLLGCAKPAADPYSSHYGEAYWANRDAMIANPEAGSDEPVLGLDGETAEGVMGTYREEQADQEMVGFDDDESMTNKVALESNLSRGDRLSQYSYG